MYKQRLHLFSLTYTFKVLYVPFAFKHQPMHSTLGMAKRVGLPHTRPAKCGSGWSSRVMNANWIFYPTPDKG